ncbi:urea transporter [Sporosarcina thermotolerans]|nr:urea transporter [Sporosarcina thermotolerans]WHT49156.1 urea transporter [Sporosarcina thermotolerans]
MPLGLLYIVLGYENEKGEKKGSIGMESGGKKGVGKRFPLLLATMKGISQVILIENWVTGLFILTAIMITSLQLGLMAFLSAAVGTLFGRLGGGNPAIVERGLYGYNSMLTGMALFLFLEGPVSWGLLYSVRSFRLQLLLR